MTADYTPGDAPLPHGTVVLYEDDEYQVDHYQDPLKHPRGHPAAAIVEAYPDGVAYFLWPVGMPKKMGNGPAVMRYIRRESVTVVRRPAPDDSWFTHGFLPAGLRVVGKNGRHGSVNGLDVGLVENSRPFDCEREYVGVEWDPVEGDMELDRRGRSFVDELKPE